MTRRRGRVRPAAATPARTSGPSLAAVERGVAAWDSLRITEGDLDRVRDFLQTRRAPRLGADMVAAQNAIADALRDFDFADTDAADLLGLVMLADSLRRVRDTVPVQDAPPVLRWAVVLYRLIVAAEAAGHPPLTLARHAILSVLSRSGAWRELVARARRHYGFAGAVLPLLMEVGTAGEVAAQLARVRGVTKKKTPLSWREREPREEVREDLDGAIIEEIARRLRGRSDLDGYLDAAMEGLPAGITTPSPWDYVARDAAQRIRRDEGKREPRGVAAAETRSPDEDPVLRALIAQAKADPRLAAALEATTTRRSQADVARTHKVSVRVLQRGIADLRRLLTG
jgi:hypothetical protein